MNTAEFNLLYEPWVAVITNQGVEKEVSLLDVFEHAHDYRSLAGELPTQDFAVLRLLLAVLYATFTRTDIDGTSGKIDSPDKALIRWKQLWDRGSFPIEVIKSYLTSYEDRFWLFHPERPFYQVANLAQGTEYSGAKLIGDLSEGSNKPRLFPLRSGSGKETLGNSETTRWLLYLNGFDDTSAKPSARGVGMPSPGAGWLGKLGLVAIEGENLFETLLFNFVLLNNKDEPFAISSATWELAEVRHKEREKITIPIDPLELLTLQSRRILLKRENGCVSGFLLLGGDFFTRENAFVEQMTTWRNSTAKTDICIPKRHRESRQVWREFSSLLAEASEQQHRPGVVSWMATLRKADILKHKLLRLRIAGIQFADKDFYVDGIISDSLTMSTGLLADLGEGWIIEIGNLLNKTDRCVWFLGILAQDIAKASGGSDEKSIDGIKAAAQERAYFALDIPFRKWLAQLEPSNDDHDAQKEAWVRKMRKIIMDIANSLVEEAGEKAIRGISKKTDDDKTVSLNAPKALGRFKCNIAKECDL